LLSTDKYLNVLNEIIDKIILDSSKPNIRSEVNSRLENVKDRNDAKEMTEVFFQYINSKKEDEVCEYIINQFVAQGFPYYMLKMDYPDGEKLLRPEFKKVKVTKMVQKLSSKAPENMRDGVQDFITNRWVNNGGKSYTEVSVSSFSEFFVTKEIAASILGAERVQEVLLIKKHTKIEDVQGPDVYVLAVEMNRKFKDFSSNFNDSQRTFEDTIENKKGEEEKHSYPLRAIDTLGFGETLALQEASGNYDALGGSGGNGGYDEEGYFAIDLGKALNKNKNKILNHGINSLLLVEQGKHAKNFSMFDNTSLTSRVKGLLLLHRAMGHSVDAKIVKSYGHEFYMQYLAVQPVGAKFKKYEDYFKFKIGTSSGAEKEHYRAHLAELHKIKKRLDRDAAKIIEIGKTYLNIDRDEVEIIDGLSKLAVGNPAKDLSCRSVNGKVLLNHIRHTNYTDDKLPICSLNRLEGGHFLEFVVKIDDSGQRNSAAKNIENILRKFISNTFIDDKAGTVSFKVSESKVKDIVGLLSDQNILKNFEKIGEAQDQALSPSSIELKEDSLEDRIKYLVKNNVIEAKYINIFKQYSNDYGDSTVEIIELINYVDLKEDEYFKSKMENTEMPQEITHKKSFDEESKIEIKPSNLCLDNENITRATKKIEQYEKGKFFSMKFDSEKNKLLKKLKDIINDNKNITTADDLFAAWNANEGNHGESILSRLADARTNCCSCFFRPSETTSIALPANS